MDVLKSNNPSFATDKEAISNKTRTSTSHLSGDFYSRLRKNKEICLLLSYFMANAKNIPNFDLNQTAFAVFDSDGYMLKLFGDERIQKRLTADNLAVGSAWTISDLEYNAVTYGLSAKRSIQSVGEENSSGKLKCYSISFIFIPSGTTDTPYSSRPPCGIALISPLDYRLTQCTTAALLSYGLELSMYECSCISELYKGAGHALMVINKNLKTGEYFTHNVSENIYDILQAPREVDISYSPLNETIAEQENPEFWEIITQKKSVQNYPISLKVSGTTRNYQITTFPYKNNSLCLWGTYCLITTPQKVSEEITSKLHSRAIHTFDTIIGQSSALRASIYEAKMIAASTSNIMLLGESGVGKDVFAQAIHNSGSRSDKPYIAINCGAMPKDLIASELFGYERGAFTGANKEGAIGKFELANGGTLFLDEIGELPIDVQATLLRVVEEKKFMRIGGRTPINVDVRIISATNCNIPQMIEQKTFRADLYYRLNTFSIKIPPLRDRDDDVILLSEHFANNQYRRNGNQTPKKFSDNAKMLMKQLSWPGNVRELQNIIERVCYLCEEPVIDTSDILRHIDVMNLTLEKEQIPIGHKDALRVMPEKVEEDKKTGSQLKKTRIGRGTLTKEDLLRALDETNGNVSAAAKALGISRKGFYLNLKRLGLWEE